MGRSLGLGKATQRNGRPFALRVIVNPGIFLHMAERSVLKWGGMEIPCMLVLSCSSKVKLNRLKEVLENKICR